MSTTEDIVQEPHDEFPDLLAGEPCAPDHDLDLESFDLEWDDDEPVDSPQGDVQGPEINEEGFQ